MTEPRHLRVTIEGVTLDAEVELDSGDNPATGGRSILAYSDHAPPAPLAVDPRTGQVALILQRLPTGEWRDVVGDRPALVEEL